MKKIMSSKFSWLYFLVILIAVNFLASQFHYRLDLTARKAIYPFQFYKTSFKKPSGQSGYHGFSGWRYAIWF
jgi:hypothetical protein